MDSQRLADATVRECFEISKKYRENFAAKHGVMMPPDSQVNSWDATQKQLAEQQQESERLRLEYQRGEVPDPAAATPVAPADPSPSVAAISPAPTQPQPSSSGWSRWALPAALVALAGVGGWAAHGLMSPGAAPPTPAVPPAPPATPVEDGGSLLQWLEDESLHLPPQNGNGG